MLYSAKITIISVLLLSALFLSTAFGATAARAHDSLPAADTVRRVGERDSLLRLQTARQKQYRHDFSSAPLFSVSTSNVFESDGGGLSEAVATSPLCLPVRFGLSSGLNRFLPYGNTAPIAAIIPEGELIAVVPDPLIGNDRFTATEISSIRLLPNNLCHYTQYPEQSTVPEGSFTWENGVFNEDLFSVRFMRPFSKQLSVNAFTDFRRFAATDFSHEGNGVLSFYQSFSADTTLFVDNGHYPLANDFTAGIKTRWAGNAGSDLYAGMKYADCNDQVPFADPKINNGALSFAIVNQYRSTISLGADHTRFGPALVDLEGVIENDAFVRHKTSALRDDAANRELSFAARAAAPFFTSDTLALSYRIMRTDRTPFNFRAVTSLEQTPEASIALPFSLGDFYSICKGSAGYLFYALDDSLGARPVWSLSLEGSQADKGFRLYAKGGTLPYWIPFDSAYYSVGPLLDPYRLAGGELWLQRGLAALTIGFQSISGIADPAARRGWPEGMAPYAQPRLVALAAPSFGPWHSLTLASRLFVSDRKPTFKGQCALACSYNPETTHEFIDTKIALDYWSARDTLLFANRTDWNRPLYDVNVEIAVQVASFRFFSKVSNLLDRRFAYVPGYDSPGLTFRWGISWYLQR
jgi:hypothetical protein